MHAQMRRAPGEGLSYGHSRVQSKHSGGGKSSDVFAVLMCTPDVKSISHRTTMPRVIPLATDWSRGKQGVYRGILLSMHMFFLHMCVYRVMGVMQLGRQQYVKNITTGRTNRNGSRMLLDTWISDRSNAARMRARNATPLPVRSRGERTV